jgi:3-oxoacyl-(acyl-carrier-protein) synthase
MRDVLLTGAFVVPPGADPAAAMRRRPPRLARMDRLCVLALAAADGALASAGLDPDALPPERLAVVVGTRFGCHATNEAYYRGLRAEGAAASPRLFAYTLPSSPLGEVSIHLAARGPGETVASGRHAGLEALGRAARIVDVGSADVAIAIAVEVGGGTLPALGIKCEEGAVAFVVERERRATAPLGVIGGAATAFVAGDPDEAREVARARAVADAGLGPRDGYCAFGGGEEDGGAVAAASAFESLLRYPHEVDRACAAVADEGGGAAAVFVAIGPRGSDSKHLAAR